jgi:outer membrane protein TolC
MMKRYIFLFVFIIIRILAFPQLPDSITLDYCYKLAATNFPLARQAALMSESSELRKKNINKNWLPQMNFNGSASLQSDVTSFEIPRVAGLPPIESPTISKDWYKLTLDVNQALYEGNITAYQKKLEGMNLQADEKALQIELYKLKDRINQVFLSIFIVQENEKLLKSNEEKLAVKLKEVNSAVANGIQLASNADAIRAELLRIGQQLTEARIDRSSAFRMLSQLISVEIPETAKLSLPQTRIISFIYENKRFEAELFDLQVDRVYIMKNMVTTKWNPKVYAFGQLGYGRPGLNMLSDAFDPWWMFGAKLTWNFFNWNQNKNEKKIYDIQGEILKSQKDAFDVNLKISTENNLAQIMKLSELLSGDQEIINLRERITKSASSQVDNGVITSAEYISRMNEETQARLSRQLHIVQLELAKLTYLYNLGKL